MPIRISEIHVQNLGPVDAFSFKPGLFNLVYGRNERGKTYLVEFLIRSLFRNAKEWKLRAGKGTGKVHVQGLGGKTESFSVSSGKKLEDFWEQTGTGLPADFSRLLVVKGAEPSLAEGGVDKAILKNLLSGMDVLDEIQNRISKTVQGAGIANGIIVGENKGEIKDRKLLEDHLKGIDALFDQIDKGYSGGRRKLLSDLKEKAETELGLLERAKRHRAFRIAEDIKTLERDKDRIDEDKLKLLREKLHLFQQKTAEAGRKRVSQSGAEKRSEHYEWLKSATGRYRELAGQAVVRPKTPFLIAALVFSVLSIVLMLLRLNVFAAASLGCALAFGFIYARSLHTAAGQALNLDELNGLKREFQNRFGQKLSGLPHLEEALQKMEPDYGDSRVLKKQLADDVRQIENLGQDMLSLFSDLNARVPEPDAWNAELRRIEEELKALERGVQEKRVLLARLGVEPGEYEHEPPGTEYDERRYVELKRKLEETQKELDDQGRKLDSLKHMICKETNDSISIPWHVLIQNLKNKHQAVLEEYRDLQAEILGKIAVMRVLESVRKGEDEKILEGLNSKTVLDALRKITRRYRSLTLEGDRLAVSDPYQEFGLSELSTGAQEQVLLSLRIGFASRLLKQESLFLIFDDAFQYSDWERRGFLVDAVVDLAKEGWQIFYFTMDDHIRDLFDARGKTFGKEYVKVELK